MKRLSIICITCLVFACSDQAPPEPENAFTETLTINLPQSLETDGVVTDFAMLSENAGPTTISIAPDGAIWYTLSSGNAIGKMQPDGSGMMEYPIPTPNSSPRIIALGQRRQYVVFRTQQRQDGTHYP